MAFTNRWICKVEEEFDIGKIKDRNGLFWEEEGKKYKLSNLLKFYTEIKSYQENIILHGVLYFQWEDEIRDYEIKKDALEETKQLIRRTSVIPFWLSEDGIMAFANSSASTIRGRDILSKILFEKENAIKKIEFNIKQIERDIRNGTLQGMWTYYFTERPGSVTKGIHYGEDIDQNDTLYQETLRAPKNFIGFKVTIDNELVKIRITKKGSITLMGDYNDPTFTPDLFRIISDFMSYTL